MSNINKQIRKSFTTVLHQFVPTSFVAILHTRKRIVLLKLSHMDPRTLQVVACMSLPETRIPVYHDISQVLYVITQTQHHRLCTSQSARHYHRCLDSFSSELTGVKWMRSRFEMASKLTQKRDHGTGIMSKLVIPLRRVRISWEWRRFQARIQRYVSLISPRVPAHLPAMLSPTSSFEDGWLLRAPDESSEFELVDFCYFASSFRDAVQLD